MAARALAPCTQGGQMLLDARALLLEDLVLSVDECLCALRGGRIPLALGDLDDPLEFRDAPVVRVSRAGQTPLGHLDGIDAPPRRTRRRPAAPGRRLPSSLSHSARAPCAQPLELAAVGLGVAFAQLAQPLTLLGGDTAGPRRLGARAPLATAGGRSRASPARTP